MIRIATAAMLCIATLGCKDRDRTGDKNATAARSEATLVGTWMTTEPVTFSGEGLRTETSGGRTTYRADGGFDYSGKLRIVGEKLPTAGLSFDIAGKGEWKQGAGTLSERFTAVTLTPEAPNAPIDRLAKTLAAEMASQPAAETVIVDLTPDMLTLRDKASNDVATFTREVEEVK